MTVGESVRQKDHDRAAADKSRRPFAYVPEIDSLRAAAVMAVILFHCGLLSWGWAGVWLFFVISGFAITTSLLNSEARKVPRAVLIRNFYIRRSLRIWPLYFVYIALASLCLLAAGYTAPFSDLPWVLTFTENIRHMFRPLPEDSFWLGFVILWSLAVEEQVYLVFPALFAWLSRPMLVRVLAAVICAAPVARYLVGALAHAAGWPLDHVGRAVYACTPAQADSFALGCLLALYRPKIEANLAAVRLAAASAPVCGLVYAGFYSLKDTGLLGSGPVPAGLFLINAYGGAREMWVYTVIAGLSAGVIALVLARETWVIRLLRYPFLQAMGRISYGAYILHGLIVWMFTSWLVNGHNGGEPLSSAQEVLLFLLACPLILCASYISYHVIEKPFLVFARRFG